MSHRGYLENKLWDIDQLRHCRRNAYLFRKNISNLSSVNSPEEQRFPQRRRFPCLFNRLHRTRKSFVFILSITDVKGFSFRLVVWNLKLLFILRALEREKRMPSGAAKKIWCCWARRRVKGMLLVGGPITPCDNRRADVDFMIDKILCQSGETTSSRMHADVLDTEFPWPQGRRTAAAFRAEAGN